MQLAFSIKSSTHYLRFLRRVIAALRLPHKVTLACSLSLVEAVNNALFHAHKKEEKYWIDIVIRADKRSVEMSVADRGAGFEMPEVGLPSAGRETGRGLFIIRSLMHEVGYRRGKINRLRMVRYL